MDLTQALLCLVSFTSPSNSKDSEVNFPCPSIESAQALKPEFDLNFHLMPVEKNGGGTVLAAGMGFLSIPSEG